jgi:hypothetical protein
MAFVRDAVRSCSCDGANRRCDDALQRRTPGDQHTELYSSG